MAFNFVTASSQYVDLTAYAAGIKTAEGSMSFRFKSSTSGVKNVVFSCGTSSTNWCAVVVGGGGIIGGASSIGYALRPPGASYTILFGVSNGAEYYCDGVWHNIIIVLDGIDNRIYVDGVEETPVFTVGNATTANAFINLVTMGNVWFSNSTYNASYLTGELEDMRITTRFYSDQDAQNISAGGGSDCIVANQKARWLFEGKAPGQVATNLQDLGGNGYDGTPTNSPTLIDSPVRLTQ